MEIGRTAVLLLHPLLGLILIAWLFKQHGWRARGRVLTGAQRVAARESHERWGRRFVPVVLFTVILAYTAQITRGLIDGKGWNAYLIPSVHGIFGLLGIILLLVITKIGKRIVAARETGERWSELRLKHGRAADIIIILAVLHGFLGFLYIFEVL